MNPPALTAANETIKILIVAGPDPIADWMAIVVNSEEGMLCLGLVRNLAQALETVEQMEPDVILVDTSSGILQEGDLIDRLAAPISGAAVIVAAATGEMDSVRHAMLHGAQGFLLKPFGEEELLSSIRQAYDLTLLRRQALSDVPRLSPDAAAGRRGRAEIVTVFSPKGGVGCTTVAVNLAVALKSTSDKPVILVDGDLRFGDVDVALNINTNTSVGTLLPQLDELEDRVLDHSLVKHNTGIKVLVAPHYLDMADAIEPAALKRLIARLAGLGSGYIVIDAWSTLDDCTLAYLDICDQLVLVTTPQVAALRDTYRFLEALGLLEFDMNKVSLVVNQCYQRSNFQRKDVERALGRPINHMLEHANSRVATSINRGIPLIKGYEHCATSQNILHLARSIATKRKERKDSNGRPVAAAKENDNSTKRQWLFRKQPTAAKRPRA